MSLIIKKNTTFKIPKDRVVAPITLGPPLPSTILLQGGWKNSNNNTIIDGSYIKGSGTYLGTTIFYYNTNVLVGDGYSIDGYDYYPILFFDSAPIFPSYGPWIIIADDIAYKNSSTNNQVIPSTNWSILGTSLPIGTIQAVN